MGIVSLLKAMGTTTPRYVSVDGRVLLGSPLSTPNDVGGTSIQPHQFHGGSSPTLVSENAARPWWITDMEKKRRDIAEMMEAFRSVRVLDDAQGFAYLVDFNTGNGTFQCLVLPRVDGSLPRVAMLKPRNLGRRESGRFVRAPHLYDNDLLCIADTSDWDAEVHGTVVAACWTAHWLACYTDWRATGSWPVEGLSLP